MRNNLSRRFLIVILCFTLLLSFCACTKSTSAGSSGKSTKDTLTVVLNGDIESFSPSEGTATPHFQTVRQIFETLTYRDKDMKLQPLLADSWEWKNDTTLILHIHKGVKFNDGTELKASDVLFTAKYSIEKKTTGFANFRAIDIAKSSCPDDYTVQFVLTAPQPNQLELFESPLAGIMSEAAVKKFGNWSSVETCVGTGPYILKAYKSGDNLTMEANPNYWNKDLAPKIKNVIFRIVTDPSAMAILAETGKADIVYGISVADMDRIKANKKINFVTALGTNTCFYTFNVGHKPLDNPKVREAIWYAIDRASAIKAGFGASGKINNTGVFSEGLGGRHPDLSKYFVKQDVAKSKALLKEAGYENGFNIKIVSYNTQDRINMTEAVQAQLAAVGIKAEIVTNSSSAVASMFANAEEDIGVIGYSATTFEVGRNLVRFLPDSTDIGVIGPWKNDEYISTVTTAMKTVDQDARYKLFYKAQEILMQERILLPMVQNEINAALQTDVKGFYIMRSYEHHLLQFVYFG